MITRENFQQLNLVDRLYYGYFLVLGLVVVVFHTRVPHWHSYLGLHALILMIITALALAQRRSKVIGFLHDWYPLAIFIFCFEEISRLSLMIIPHWQDAYLLSLEARVFPTPPTVWFGTIATPWLTEIMEIGYFSYFVLLMIVGGVLYGRSDRRPFRQVMTASVASYLLCYVVFILFPTEGPAHTLRALHTTPIPGGGPFHWAVLLIQRHAGVHGCAFPSSHVAAGFVDLIFAWKCAPRLGAALTPLVIFLCLGAVYDRYHYASDVVAGLMVGALAAGLVFALERSPALMRESHLYAGLPVNSVQAWTSSTAFTRSAKR